MGLLMMGLQHGDFKQSDSTIRLYHFQLGLLERLLLVKQAALGPLLGLPLPLLLPLLLQLLEG